MADFAEFSEVLRRASGGVPPAEVHGLLSALACVPGDDRVAILQGEVLGPEVSAPATADVREILADAWRETRAALDAPDCAFDLLLPDDEESLVERTEALGSWCHGFLAGLGLGGIADHDKSLSSEAREFLDDLKEMSRIESDPVEDEESEAAFAELVEYLRVGVLLLHEEIGTLAAHQPAIGRLH
ncbi:MAG: UPF0149 family protein [Pseudomonadota bacterium]